MFVVRRFRRELLFALALAGCQDAGAPIIPHGLTVTLTPAAVFLLVGDSTTLTGDVRDSTGAVAPYPLAWTSADSTVAHVGPTGIVTALAAGTAMIYATTIGARDSVRVSVLGPLATITVKPDSGWVYPGGSLQLVATLRDSGGHAVTLTDLPWASGDSTIATVTPAGVVSGMAIGFTTISATFAGVTGQTPLRVLRTGVAVTLSLEPPVINVAPGAVIPFRVAVVDTGGQPVAWYPLQWTSGDTTVVAREAEGITARAPGVALMTVGAQPGVDVPPTPAAASVRVRQVTFRQVESGDGAQNCGVATDLLAYCWGYFDARAFGIGDLSGLETGPIAVTDSIHFQEIHGGEYYDCGLSVDGLAYCWGMTAGGRLGTGTILPIQYHPVAVTGGHVFTSLGVGHSTACGIEGSGAMYCWGRNGSGEVGNGIVSVEPAPVLVTGGLTWRSVAPGTLATCGITTDSTAYCWGANFRGQLGTGDSTERHTPTPVAGGYKFIMLSSANDHTCGVTDAGVGLCWGYNYTGALGDSTTTGRAVPTPVAGGLTFKEIRAGGHHSQNNFTCGLTVAGTAYCWGENADGELGNGTTVPANYPVPVSGGLTFTALSAGAIDVCGIVVGGVTYCWGASFESAVPVRVAGQP